MTNPRELLVKDRADLSPFLVHLTRNGSYEQYVDMGGGFYDYPKSKTMTAGDSLNSILSQTPTPSVNARSPVGYFKYKINLSWTFDGRTGTKTRGGVDPNWLKCVCFSEAPLVELKHFYKATVRKRNEYKKYGLGFYLETIRNKGGNPVFYIDSKPRKPKSLLGPVDYMLYHKPEFQTMMPYTEPFGPRILSGTGDVDFRWEREWRIVGDLAFTLDEPAFGICSEEEIPHFDKLVKQKFPFIDPDWEPELLKEYLDKKGWKKLVQNF